MPRRLSIPNLLAALILSAAAGLRAGVGVTTIRQSGASLDLSIQNEADHAVRQAASWLASNQHADGSWGVSNRVRLTSLSLLALSASRQPGCSEAVTRAALWLDKHATNRVDDLETHAWRLLALAHVLPDSPARPAALGRFTDAARPLEAQSSADARALWSEALAASGLGAAPTAAPDAPARLARLSAAWPGAPGSNADAWQDAHFINRAGRGQLLRGNTPLDWRRDLAQRLISAQRRASENGGYWNAPDSDAKLAETAFGLLTLLEL
jgi:hypothetical protein